MKAQYLLAVPAFLLFMACNDQNAIDTVNNMDRSFVTQASNENFNAMDNGRSAAENGENGEVRQFGHMTMEAHGVSQVALQQTAQEADIPIPERPAIDHPQQPVLNGRAFDEAYIDAAVANYERMVRLYEMEVKTGIDKGLKAYAKDQLPVLKDNLTKAREIANNY